MDRATIAQQESPAQERDRLMNEVVILRAEKLELQRYEKEVQESCAEKIARAKKIESEAMTKKNFVMLMLDEVEKKIKTLSALLDNK